MNIIRELMSDYGREDHEDERPVYLHTMENENGMKVSVMDRGATVTRVIVPDREGNFENVVLGFDDVQDYRTHADLCAGATIGRTAGRIGNGTFPLDGVTYEVTKNEGNNNLHGGLEFNTAIWEAEDLITSDTASVVFRYVSPDGSNGYPGEVTTQVTYTLGNDDTFTIHLEASSTKDTVLSLTNHTYFNLSGNLKEDIQDHALKADVSHFLELGADNIPTGVLVPVDYTPFDFRRGRMLRSGIISSYAQNVLVGNGYDHPLIFAGEEGEHRLVLSEAMSGRTLTMKSDFPAVVLYTGNFIRSGYCFREREAQDYLGVAIEMQAYPDSENHSAFPSAILRAGEPYDHTIQWKFTVG